MLDWLTFGVVFVTLPLLALAWLALLVPRVISANRRFEQAIWDHREEDRGRPLGEIHRGASEEPADWRLLLDAWLSSRGEKQAFLKKVGDSTDELIRELATALSEKPKEPEGREKMIRQVTDERQLVMRERRTTSKDSSAAISGRGMREAK